MAAATDTAPAPKKGPSLVVQLAVLLLLTLAAVGTGWFTGQFLQGQKPTAESAGEDAAGDAPMDEAQAEAPPPQPLHVYKLETITTNLADPTDVWVRLEVGLVFKDQPDPRLAELVHQDLLAYLRTVKSKQIEGPSGFQHLKSDLDERAQIRSEGRIKQVLVRTLLFE